MKDSGLNASVKRQRLSEWIKKQDPAILCVQKTHFRYKYRYTVKANAWKSIQVNFWKADTLHYMSFGLGKVSSR